MPLVEFAEIREYVLSLAPEHADPQMFRAMAVIVSSMAAGTDPAALAAYTGYPIQEIEPMVRNLRRDGIFGEMDLRVNPLAMAGGESGSVAAAMVTFAGVATGQLMWDQHTQTVTLTDQGRRLAEQLMEGRR